MSVVSDLISYYEYNPGVRNRPQPVWRSEPVHYTINVDTLHERFDYDVVKPEGVYRIASLGDSWTFGVAVRTEENYSEQLEDILNREYRCDGIKRFEVINFGMGGYDLAYSVERMRSRALKYSPDFFIMHVIHNDFQDINEFLLVRAQWYRTLLGNTTSTRDRRLAISAEIDAQTDQRTEISSEERVEYQRNQLMKARMLTDKPLLFYTIQTPSRIQDEDEVLLREVLGDNVAWYDSALTLSMKEILPDSHPSPEGHRLMADDLAEYVTEQYLNCDKAG